MNARRGGARMASVVILIALRGIFEIADDAMPVCEGAAPE
jgi:hypothetical protein